MKFALDVCGMERSDYGMVLLPSSALCATMGLSMRIPRSSAMIVQVLAIVCLVFHGAIQKMQGVLVT